MQLIFYFSFIFILSQFASAGSIDSVGDMLQSIKKANGISGTECGGKNSSQTSMILVTPEVCASRDKFFQGLSRRTMSVEQSVQWLSDQKAQVIILGENHYSPSNDFQPELIRKLISKNKDINCLFFERESRFGNSSEKVDKDSRSLDEYYTWKKNAEVASKKGVAVYYVDNVKLPKDKNGDFIFYAAEPKGMEFRNAHMSERISKLISSGTCKASIAINGKEHLFENVGENGFYSLQSKLKAQGVSVRTVNLQDYFRPDWEASINAEEGRYPRSSEPDFSWNWKDCPQNPYNETKQAGFVSTKSDRVPFTYYRSSSPRTGSWSDFDMTILLP